MLIEDSPFGTDFLAQLQRDGEAATAAATAVGIRVVHLRIGNVVSGPAITKLTKNIRALGSGEQWWAWIAREGMGSVVRHILVTDTLDGPVAVARIPVP
jgi:NAD dependent epimerase/dehydratase family enzyme